MNMIMNIYKVFNYLKLFKKKCPRYLSIPILLLFHQAIEQKNRDESSNKKKKIRFFPTPRKLFISKPTYREITF